MWDLQSFETLEWSFEIWEQLMNCLWLNVRSADIWNFEMVIWKFWEQTYELYISRTWDLQPFETLEWLFEREGLFGYLTFRTAENIMMTFYSNPNAATIWSTSTILSTSISTLSTSTSPCSSSIWHGRLRQLQLKIKS